MRSRITSPGLIALALAVVAVAGCPAPTSTDSGVSTSSGSSNGSLLGGGGSAIGVATAPYIIVDLSTGAYETRAEVADLAANATYRAGKMVFKRVTGTGTDFFLAVFEVTQAQWTAMGGSGTPWTTVPTAIVGTSATGATMPAFSVSWFEVGTAMGAFNGRGPARLSLPSAAQWAAAAGGGPYAWGSSTDAGTVTAHAAVAETQAGTAGPRAVGGRAANAAGFHDLSGNIWEWMADGRQVRGGSWYHGLSAARVDSTLGSADGVVAGVDHALIGARFVLTP